MQNFTHQKQCFSVSPPYRQMFTDKMFWDRKKTLARKTGLSVNVLRFGHFRTIILGIFSPNSREITVTYCYFGKLSAKQTRNNCHTCRVNLLPKFCHGWRNVHYNIGTLVSLMFVMISQTYNCSTTIKVRNVCQAMLIRLARASYMK